ncbi:MAG: NAD(P)H-dependent oxidoreductase subunit E [Alkalilacustris sp.]
MTPLPSEPEIAASVKAALGTHGDREGALLPVLQAVHATLGYLPPTAVTAIARGLGRGVAEVEGVVSFHDDFRRRPAGRRIVRLCRAEACQAVGGRALAEHTQQRLGIDWGETTACGGVTLESAYCLGLCACGPAALVDGQVRGRLTPASLDRLLTEGTP